MSNALKRKVKKMQPVGYSKKEISSINKYSKERSRMNNTTYNAYLDVRLIAYQILHDKLEFSKRSEVYRCQRKKRKELVNNVYMNMRVKHGILGAYRI